MWYTASLLFSSKHQPDTNKPSLWEEQIVLIEAVTEGEAIEKAASIGVSSQHSYQNESGEVVEWTFEVVERVCAVMEETLTDGVELFSRFIRPSEAQSLMNPFNEEEL